MTARRRTLEASAAQERVIAALLSTGDTQVAERLGRCMEAMTTRRHGAGWPWTCRSPGCAWCGISLARRWWKGVQHWVTHDGAQVSLAVLPLSPLPGDLRAAAARLRRSIRDLRDRAARRGVAWRGVAIGGMATGDGTAFVHVRHTGLARSEVAAVLRTRWPAAVITEVGASEPSWAMSVEDATELARARRGVEPLRIVVLAQRAADRSLRDGAVTRGTPTPFEPMPIAF